MSYDQMHQREMREQLAADKAANSVSYDQSCIWMTYRPGQENSYSSSADCGIIDMTIPSVPIDKGTAPTSEQLAGALWDAVFGKGAWDNAERCNANREIRNRWIVAVTPFCGVPANITARFKASEQTYAAPDGFLPMLEAAAITTPEPTLEEIDAMAAKLGLVVIKMPPPPDKRFWEDRTPASLTAPLPAPDARFGSGK